MNQSPTEVEKARGLHRFAVLTAGATFCLIFVGGLVTSTGSALAVPDWPLAFGKLIPAWKGGIRFEFGHRVAAGTVVCLTLVLMAWAWRGGPDEGHGRGPGNPRFPALVRICRAAVLE